MAPRTPLFHRIFVANRGEVAVRIAKACDDMDIVPVLAVSSADHDAPYTRGRETVNVGPARPALSYLDMRAVVQAAKQSGCTAVHPGWGFLAENPVFASLCESHGLTFIGPPASVMHLMGTKTPAKRAMAAGGLDLIPGSDGVLASVDEARTVADRIGYPILLKAESGGGGRGMRVARSAAELADAYAAAQAEAQAAFADPRLYLEKLIEGGRHVEIQVMADKYGAVCHVGERDCTVQRNHQKLIEESPSPALSADERERTLQATVHATAAIGYVGAGTMEFLLDHEGTLRFMEMNTRLQVEHSVSEMRAGVDLVKQQILVAAGHRLGLNQSQIRFDGHVIECRINAEDPENNFRPSPGTITRWISPAIDDNLRVDTHVMSGSEIPPHYDSLLCKVIAKGADRNTACDRMIRALKELVCEGVHTTAAMHIAILRSAAFQAGDYDTRRIPGWPPTPPSKGVSP